LKTFANIFAIFLQPSQVRGLSVYKQIVQKSCVFAQLKRVTDRQTDEKAISIAQRLRYNVR